MKQTSFKKGDQFEKFVEDTLFQASDYVLVSRTNNYDQNKTRYACKLPLKPNCLKVE
jgi:hypothetical protein